jgi:DNA-binding CsgD family transcriptional regulator
MSLSHRPTTPQDLEACLPLIRNGFAFGLAERPHLLALWRHLLDKGITESTVIEERTGPTGSRIVGFGLSIFVTDEFAEDSRTRLPPYQARHVLERWCQGKPPFLNAAQIRRANSGSGLNVVVLHHGWENTDGGKTPSPEISLKIYEAFYAHHIGYHLRHFQHEVYGEWQEKQLSNFGCIRQTDYAAATAMGFTPSPGLHPYLMGMSGEARENPHHPSHALFLYSAPHLYFCPAQQDLLRCALRGKSDAEIAAALAVSPDTIHKRWRAIFEKVAENSSLLLPESEGKGRGPEKRSRLLSYLRDHPEELRPFSSPRRDGTRSLDDQDRRRRESARR